MNAISANTLVFAVVLIVAVGAIVAWVVMQRQRTQRLQQRFGPEYARTVDKFGGRTKAEAELTKREQRVARLNITPLAPADAARFSQAWNALQSRFTNHYA